MGHESHIPVDAAKVGHGGRLDEVVSFAAILRRRWRFWAVIGPFIFAALSYYALCIKQQPVAAVTSVSIEQPAAIGSALSLLTGGAPGSTRYTGVLESRRLAEEVEKDVRLKEILHLPKQTVISRLMSKWLEVKDDSEKGLVLITVSLDGPPLLARSGVREREKLDAAAASAANAYALSLSRYYITTDNDRDSVLRRAAREELQRAQREYRRSVEMLQDFSRSLLRVDPKERPDFTAAPGDALPDLYAALAQVDTQIRSSESQNETSDRLVDSQLENLPALPTEDPLLKDARQAVTTASSDLKDLEIQFGDNHPRVVDARDRLRIAQQRLQQETVGVRAHLTTSAVQASVDLAGLTAKREGVQKQLDEALGKLPKRQVMQFRMETLKDLVDLRKQALQTVSQEELKLRMQTAPEQSRVVVVDKAIPAPPIPSQETQRALLVSVALQGLKMLAVTLLFVAAASVLEASWRFAAAWMVEAS